MSDPTTLSVEREEHVLLVGLRREAKRNAFNLAMLRELAEAYTEFEDDPELRCAVLFAHGDHFTAGLDLAEVGPEVAKGTELFPEGHVDPLDLLGRRRSKPVVMAVQGYCFTIGIELLLASDIRLAADTTRFRQMEVNRGIMPFGGATLRMPEVAGWGNAMRYLLTGDEFDAAEAHRIGIVQEVLPASELLDRARALASRVAACAPLAVHATRQNAARAVEDGSAAALEVLYPEARRLMGTEDAAEGVRSFLERREGRFQGR
ncbi:MAG: crotonase/enoyl-CoA hydratase family protein [Myxococcota bacterium]